MLKTATFKNYLNKQTDASPLAVFRILFGLLMLWSLVRFAANGWIHSLYIEPQFFFSYYGFEWVKPLGVYTYGLFLVCGLSALFITFGYKYRFAVITFFLSFTYIELMDKTTYLNHYYFISVLSFLMIFLPANAYYSVDAWRNDKLNFSRVPAWCIDSIKLLLIIVYFYAGLAKLNSDWLFKAMPLQIWLPSNYSLPLFGDFFQQPWIHYVFSWAGALYDLSIPFLLIWKRTRVVAFVLVVIFHLLTRVLFPIGMFPYIMIASALIFFDPVVHHRILDGISRISGIKKEVFDRITIYRYPSPAVKSFSMVIVAILFALQLLIPFRHLLYPGELFWTEQGYRYSWRVMLMEKAGYANFKITDTKNGNRFNVDNSQFLTPFQEKQMSTQPDFILEYAHFLHDHYKQEGIENPHVYVESYVALNGRLSRQFIDPETNLAALSPSLKNKTWILPFDDSIKGL